MSDKNTASLTGETFVVIDDKTPHLKLPLPSPYNNLEDDIGRLRASFTGLDTNAAGVAAELHAVNTELAAKADAATVNAALDKKADTSAVNAALAQKADKSAVDAALIQKADKAAVDAALSTVGGAATWDGLPGKPPTFPPGPHNHDSSYAAKSHSHTSTDFSGVLPAAKGGTGRTDGRATALATARTISLTGDVTGSANFDGSANVSITTMAGSGLKTSLAEQLFFGHFA